MQAKMSVQNQMPEVSELFTNFFGGGAQPKKKPAIRRRQFSASSWTNILIFSLIFYFRLNHCEFCVTFKKSGNLVLWVLLLGIIQI